MGQTFTRFVREMMHISDNVFYMSLSILFLVFCLMIAYWFYTRRRMQELKHQIPATVLKNYLDSVIQNSNALKSSLFRGGGLEAGIGIPSVFPTSSLPTGNIADNSEELNRKNAEISSLHSQISNKNQQITELEKMLRDRPAGSAGDADLIAKLNSDVTKLKGQLDAARADLANSGSGGGIEQEVVDKLEQEKAELQNRLKEYEIIEEDLANLRRLQQENDQLKATLEKMKAAPAAAAPAPTPEPEQDLTNAPVSDGDEDLEAAMAAAISESKAAPPAADEDMMVPSNEGEQKSAEELLSEFEKMLG